MGFVADIFNLEIGLAVRNKLNVLMKFYNAVVKSDSLFNVERIDASFVKDATPTTTKFLRDDGTWQVVATNQDLEQTLANGESTGFYTIYFNFPPILVNETQAKVMTVNHVQQLVASSVNINDIQLKSLKGIANGYASLDASGKIPVTQIAITIQSLTSSATPTLNTTDDVLRVSALAQNATFAAPVGTVIDGKSYVIEINDNGTARTLAYNSIFNFGATAPAITSTIVGKKTVMCFVYLSSNGKYNHIGALTDL